MRKKILVAIILNVLIISVTLGIFSYLTVQNSIKRSLENRMMLARTLADYIEVSLQTNLNRLMDISLSGKVDLTESNLEPEQKALETAYRYSLFTDGVFLLDRHGNVLLTYPPHDIYAENLSYINSVNQVLRERKPVISGIYTLEPLKKQVLFMMVPLRDRRDTVVGVAGGVISPANLFINTLLQQIKIQNSFIEIIDANEIVLASDDIDSILKHRDYNGDLSTMIRLGQSGIRQTNHAFSGSQSGMAKCIFAFVPFKTAPWGILVGQPENMVFEPAWRLERNFILLVIAFIAMSILFGTGMSMRIVQPLKALIGETNRIAGGDLTKPVGDLGSDEVLQLSKSFDTMRIKLAASLDNIQKQNLELEHRVTVRTAQIRESRQKVRILLKKVISSQEEERKRIARHLHDETMQDISAILINLDICRVRPEDFSVQKCDELRAIVLKTMDDVHNLIQNMRPTVLDDLGLNEAILWLFEKHFKTRGIIYSLETGHLGYRRFAPEVERVLFMIAQEAIINISRHAHAINVVVTLDANDREIFFTIEDDGVGFDVNEAFRSSSLGTRGLGILGMRERVALLDGKFEICSVLGQGTRISIIVPHGTAGGNDV